MKARTGDGVFSSRYAVLFLALAALARPSSFAAPSLMPRKQQERPGLLNRLFGSKPADRIEDPPAEVARPRAEPNAQGERNQRKKKARVLREGAEPPQVAVVTKRPDARVVLVVGDFLGSGLAEGLTTAFAQNANVRIVDRTSGSSGFVRDDFYNWPEKIDELITAQRPAAIVVMLGSNDRQQMLVDDVRETVRSENWTKEYAARAAALAKAISARKVPFLWVGMPAFKSSKTMLDMLAFNDIYRAAAASAGGEFVDIWDGFVDENGAYMSTGPDINGQPARLRANDGINLARPASARSPSMPKSRFTSCSAWTRPTGSRGSSAFDAPGLSHHGAVRPDGAGRAFQHRRRRRSQRTRSARPGPAGCAAHAGAGRRRRTARHGRRAASRGAHAGRKARHRRHRAGAGDRPRRPVRRAAACLGRDGDAGDDHRPDAEQARGAVGPAGSGRGHGQAARRPFRRSDRAAARSAASRAAGDPAGPAGGNLAGAGCSGDRRRIAAAGDAGDASTRRSVPDAMVGDPLDLSPSRGAPQQAYKRPKSIGPEPNRAPTAVPQPIIELLAPAGAQEEIPAASNADGAADAAAEAKPALPDTAPARGPAPSTVPGIRRRFARPPEALPARPIRCRLPRCRRRRTLRPNCCRLDDAPAAVAAPNAPVEPADRCFGGEGRAVRACRHRRRRARRQIGFAERRAHAPPLQRNPTQPRPAGPGPAGDPGSSSGAIRPSGHG